MIETLETGTWILLITTAVLVGLGKGGVPGVANLSVPLFAMAFPAKLSAGVLLPVLVCADIVAVILYRKHAEWRYMGRLVPWTAVGIAIGFFLLDSISDTLVALIIGVLLISMTAVHFVRKWMQARMAAGGPDLLPHSAGFVAGMGIIAGFATMVANAAGPVAALYLLAIGLPKNAFIGTGAWFWLLINVSKMPLQGLLGNLNWDTLQLSLLLGLPAALGALFAPFIVKRINQAAFDALIWFFIVLAAVRLIYGALAG